MGRLPHKGEANEHLDDSIRDFADRLDHRFHGFPRCRRLDSPAADIRDHIVNSALRDRTKNRIAAAGHSVRLGSLYHPLPRIRQRQGICLGGVLPAGLPKPLGFKTS